MLDCYSEPEYWFFVLKFLLINLIGGYIIFMALQQYINSSRTISSSLIFIISLGIAPGFVSLILYYSLMLLPNQSDLTYLLIVTAKFSLLFSISLKEFKAYKSVFSEIRGWYKKYFQTLFSKLSLAVIVLFFLMTLAYLNYYIQSKTITEHDTLEYAVQGKVFFNDKSISYEEVRYDEASGFYYVGLHGFTFPLLGTTERIFNAVAGFQSDSYFRSVNMFFGFLIAFFMYTFLNRYSLTLSFMATFSLLLCYGYFETFFKYHIDNMRIFYLLGALFLLIEYIKQPRLGLLLLFGFILGLQVNTHSLGALLSIIELGVLFLFAQGNLVKKLKPAIIATIIMIFSGGIHYIIDVITGTGWIFQDLKFY